MAEATAAGLFIIFPWKKSCEGGPPPSKFSILFTLLHTDDGLLSVLLSFCLLQLARSLLRLAVVRFLRAR